MRLTSRGQRQADPRLESTEPTARTQDEGTAQANGQPQNGAPRHRRARVGPLVLAGRPAVVAVGIGLLMACSGTAGLVMANHGSRIPHPVPHISPVVPPVGPQQQTPVPYSVEHVARPVSLTIPAIGVRTKLIHLGLTRSGALQVPKTTSVAGWYIDSPPPGAVGSSVIVGHVDSYAGVGIFYNLHLLHPRDRIYVRQADGKLSVFKVSGVQFYPKNHFPTSEVYGPTPTPTLRLITCGGAFNHQIGSYVSNVVVYAALSS
jgi:Sortase domain